MIEKTNKTLLMSLLYMYNVNFPGWLKNELDSVAVLSLNKVDKVSVIISPTRSLTMI